MPLRRRTSYHFAVLPPSKTNNRRVPVAYIKLTFDDVAEVGSFHRDSGTYLVRATLPNDRTAIVFSAVLNQDIDGAPNCYARFNPASPTGLNGGLDFLRHATRDGG